MELLERQHSLDDLFRIIENVSDGEGRTVLVSGEAGVGKTSLLKQFTDSLKTDAHVLWGSCDDLFTPRPLGPLYDITFQIGSNLFHALENQDKRYGIFSLFFNYLQSSPRLKIIIIEDIHWADEATLDFIRFLSRRISRTKSILLLSYRDEEIERNSLIRSTLGELPHSEVKRIRLYPLSESAVNSLMEKAGIHNKSLYKTTGGNPFFVTEILANNNKEIPTSISAAVIARISSLSEETQNLLQLISVIPSKIELDFLKKLYSNADEHLDHCLSISILIAENTLISFRHELARLAILNSISDLKKIQLHKKVLRHLLKENNQNNFLAWIVHHASQANDSDVILRYAPLAAKQASDLGAHSLAAEHYQNALPFVDRLPAEKQLDLYEGISHEYFLTGQVERAIKNAEAILIILKHHPNPLREGEIYRRMSRMLWYDCKDKLGEEYLNKSIDILEKLPHGKQLAMAYSNKSQTYMTRQDTVPAIKWGNKALELAKKIGDSEIEAHALNNIGSCKLIDNNKAGEEDLIKSLQISLENDYGEHAARAYVNLGSILLEHRSLLKASEYFSKGVDYTNEKDIYIFGLCLAGHYAKVKMHLGDWDGAIDLAKMVLAKNNVPPGNKIMPLSVVGLIRARRNDPGGIELIEESLNMAIQMGDMENIVSSAAAKAEYFWLHNKLSEFSDELKSIYEDVLSSNNSWAIGEICYWLSKEEKLKAVPKETAKPYRLQIEGRWEEAADEWKDLLCPYEEAIALAEGNSEAMKKSIKIFENLGASAVSQFVKQKMREAGIKNIPKGPRKSTKENYSGLTQRQLEVLKLVADGLNNNDIAENLYISPKTVDHHVSAILSKLNLRSRMEAALFAKSRGIL